MRQNIKLCGDRSDCCNDMAIYRFFSIQWPSAILDLLCTNLDYPRRREEHFVVFIVVRSAKFGWNRVTSMTGGLWKFLGFASLAWKCLFTPPFRFWD